MNRLIRNIVLFLFVILISENVWALSIISPQEGLEVYAGAQLQVVVKPDAGEEWNQVLIEIFPMSYDVLTNQYKADIKIPLDASGYINFYVLAEDKSGNGIELKRTLLVKMSPNVALQSIEVEPNPLFLDKLPVNSNPDVIRVYGTRDLEVVGIYSDGVKRKQTAGVIYTSSNENIVTVDSKGKVTAQGVGKATITVRSGNYSVNVRVIVDPYK